MHAVIRRYRGASALNDLLAQRSQDVEQLLRDIPGFVAYYAIRDGDELATVTVCQDQAGTEESSRRAGESHAASAAPPGNANSSCTRPAAS